jgi:cytosine permease
MMSDKTELQAVIEDHALERVPDAQRHSWLDLSWNTVGIVTTLIQIYIGAMICFTAGLWTGMAAGATVATGGALLGWGVGHIAQRTGLSSSLMSRRHGFGIKGSVLTASIFGFMIIGFIAAENVLLYKGFLFYFKLQDNLANQVVIYGLLTLCWIGLTAWGFNAVTRVSSLMLIGFLGVLVYMMFRIVAESAHGWSAAAGFGPQLPPELLAKLGIDSRMDAYIFCVNILAGSAGAGTLIAADLGRYARSSADIGIAAALMNFFLDVVMIFLGAVILFAGMPALIEYYTTVGGVPESEARLMAVANPDRVAAAFIVFGGVFGTILMVTAQSKAQVVNTYSSSLSLANLCDALLGWRPGRFLFIVLANVLSLLFLAGGILAWFNDFLIVLGILTTAFTGIMLADYYIVRGWLGQDGGGESELVNRAGVATLVIAYLLSHHVLSSVITIEVITTLLVCLVVYPLLRCRVLRPAAVVTPS